MDSSGSGESAVVRSCEYDNEFFSSLGDGEFLHWLRNDWFVKKDSPTMWKLARAINLL